MAIRIEWKTLFHYWFRISLTFLLVALKSQWFKQQKRKKLHTKYYGKRKSKRITKKREKNFEAAKLFPLHIRIFRIFVSGDSNFFVVHLW